MKQKKYNNFLSATSFFTLWAKIATQEQADKMVKIALPKMICLGGIAGCAPEALANIDKSLMQRQWDYPNGWAQHQIVIWQGLQDYGYDDLVQEMVYRWLWLITKMRLNITEPFLRNLI